MDTNGTLLEKLMSYCERCGRAECNVDALGRAWRAAPMGPERNAIADMINAWPNGARFLCVEVDWRERALCLEVDLAGARAEIARLRAAITPLEWNEPHHATRGQCPYCDASPSEGHEDGCLMAAAVQSSTPTG